VAARAVEAGMNEHIGRRLFDAVSPRDVVQ
jgi:hypothetical protein